MARKRSPEHDWICRGCGCPCDQAGTKHLGGGQNMRACKRAPIPVLRSVYEAEAAAAVAAVRARRQG